MKGKVSVESLWSQINYFPMLGFQGVTNVHLSNVHFVLRDISALLDPSRGSCLPTLIHLVWKQWREEGGGEGMEGRHEVVKAKNLAENEVHV